MDADDEEDQGIVEEMGEVREKLGGDIEKLNEEVRNLFNWEAYVRSAPLTSVGLAVAVGYLFAPAIRSVQPVSPTPAEPRSANGGLLSIVSNLVTTRLVQLGMVYVASLFAGSEPDASGAVQSTNNEPSRNSSGSTSYRSD